MKNADNAKKDKMQDSKRLSRAEHKKNTNASPEGSIGKQGDRLAENKSKPSSRYAVVIVSVILIAVFIAGAVLGTVYYFKTRTFNYMSADLTKYVSISTEDYSGYDIYVDVKRPGDMELEERIMQTLAEHKSETPLYNGNYIINLPIKNGSTVKIWYRGYTVDEDGNQTDIEGTSNLTDVDGTELDIGSGDFVSGFEIGLIDKNISEYSGFSSVSYGEVREGDIIIVSMLAAYPDGSSTLETSLRIDLSDPKLDEKYGVPTVGEGEQAKSFADMFIGKTIGEDFEDAILTTLSNGTAVYDDISVKSAIRPTIAVREGEYGEGDTARVSYTVTDAEGAVSTVTKKLLLTEKNIGGYYEPTLADFLAILTEGGVIGQELADWTREDGEGTVYSNLKVTEVFRRGDKPITVQAYFPYDYSDEALRNRMIYFDVYVDGVIFYETPELTEQFITETLELTAEQLADFEGDGLVEKYRASVMAQLEAEYEQAAAATAEELAWVHLMQVAEFSDIPEYEIENVYEQYYNEVEQYYSGYSSYYADMQEAANDLYGLNGDVSWTDYIRELAETDVKERLVFYYIGKKEGYFPEGEKFEALYDAQVEELLADYLDDVQCKRENYSSDKEYEAAVEDHKKDMFDYYTSEEAIAEAIYYEAAMPKIVELANVIYK